ncbi:MAG: flavodoxin family protein [Betaproteobacteria bacterium]|nr:flavodoxin family protein [Betaproteobacteria bacterium]
MKTLLIVYHSRTGGARQMAEAAARGASTGEVQVRLIHAADACAEDLLAADAYLFVMPENLAAIAGAMKEFFDRMFYAVLDRIVGRAYVVLVCAGSDGANAVRQAERICTGWRLRKAAESIVVCTHAQTPQKILAQKIIGAGDLERCEDTGAALAAGLVLGVF